MVPEESWDWRIFEEKEMKSMLIRSFVFSMILSCVILGQTPKGPGKVDESFLDKYMSSRITSASPGVVIGVIKNGKLIVKEAYGYADVGRKKPLSDKDVFNLASLTKQFTAMCILLLEESGKLSTSDDIRKFLPEFPSYDRVITIDNLLHHTSGIKDYVMLLSLSGNDIWSEVSTQKVLKLLAKQKTLNFNPGTQFSYSNSGYFLLGEIIRRVSGEPVSVFAYQNIFKPLGMSKTFYRDEAKKRPPFIPSNYERVGDSLFQERKVSTTVVGSTGLYSTLEDFTKWDANLYANKLGKGKQEIIDKFLRRGQLSTGKDINYGTGIFVGTYKNQVFYFHTGLFGGFRTWYYRFPDQKSSVIIFSNGNDLITNGMDIVDIALFNIKIEEKEFTNPPAKVDFSEEAYLGVFDYTQGNYSTIGTRNNQLNFQVSGQPFLGLIQIGKDEFLTSDRKLKLTFTEPENGVFSKILFQRAGSNKVDTLFRYTKQFEISTIGPFYSDELGSEIIFKGSSNKIQAVCAGKVVGEFYQTDNDTYIGDGSTITLSRENNSINGFIFNSSRTKNIGFRRK